jgi:hypothetical protein
MSAAALDSSSIAFPRACYMLAGNVPVETICQNQADYERFKASHGTGRTIYVINACRLLTDRK